MGHPTHGRHFPVRRLAQSVVRGVSIPLDVALQGELLVFAQRPEA